MMKTTTQNDLILYAWNECGMIDSDRIQRRIDGDPLVQQEFTDIVETMNSIDDVRLQPSDESINRVLQFSRTYKA